ncbi:MAG TPA: NifB/NifX family molybdenum-iron cluster-binding protein [archaeon]|nr:NifB/NifX family molybdenum-iron cluster-binding protein [archaeon]
MRIALPVWQGRISPVFDTARKIILIEIENGREISRTEELVGEAVLPQRALKLSNLGVNVLLCGAISRPLAFMLSSSKIKVIPFLTGEADTVLQDYLDGRLSDAWLRMPGCCGRRMRFRGGR